MVPIPNKDDFMSAGAPNPFTDRTSVSIRVPETRVDIITTPTVSTPNGDGPRRASTKPVPTSVQVSVYDVKGRFVSRIFEGGLFAQVLTVAWDGTNQNGEPVASGVYFIKSIAGPHVSTRKVVVVR